MSMEPPPFQEASRCDVCKCSFNTFRRRHHCRCCGRTLCAEHSSNHMALPQFGIHSTVRVCSDCFNDASRNHDAPAISNEVNSVTDTVSRLGISEEADSKPKIAAEQVPGLSISECKCGMPLCICEAPAPPPPKDALTLQSKSAPSYVARPNRKPKKAEATLKNQGSTSSNTHFMNFNLGQGNSCSLGTSPINYEVNGEGLREAIKSGDTLAVKELLSKGVDANYCDKQGLSLLHVASVFNQTDIAFALMEYGARLDSRNLQGETPLDCAPATLQYKMKQKMEEK